MPAKKRSAAVNSARGLLMGSFDVVPGVSGGTAVLVVGIFERLIASIEGLSRWPPSSPAP